MSVIENELPNLSVRPGTVAGMNRTDRLYAIVEELRMVAPRRRSARELAARFEVSTRTIERDLDALLQAGVPIYADSGRLGGYTLDKAMTLPPLNFTAVEAVAVAVALGQSTDAPFAQAARSAIQKIVTAMSAHDVDAARELANRVRLLEPAERDEAPSIPSILQEAIIHRRVLRLAYVDKSGTISEREVEPVLFAKVRGVHWYLMAHCRLRQAARVFRVDRIVGTEATGETAPPHRYEDYLMQACDLVERAPLLDVGGGLRIL
jgi:predicted DNA-binding transcriptional regulator YafY